VAAWAASHVAALVACVYGAATVSRRRRSGQIVRLWPQAEHEGDEMASQ